MGRGVGVARGDEGMLYGKVAQRSCDASNHPTRPSSELRCGAADGTRLKGSPYIYMHIERKCI